MHADALAARLVLDPERFDVVVGSNLLGDILSEVTAAISGAIGIAPSANLNPEGAHPSLFEPIHGSAPDIAGKDVANPSAQILSFAMLLRWSFGLEEDAKLIETAIERVLAGGLRTADIMQPGMARVGTSVMGEAVVRELDKVAE